VNPASETALAMHRNAVHSLLASSTNQAAMPVPKPTTSHGGSCARSASRSFSSSPKLAETHVFQ
jgi:hypothetical protein